MCCNGFRILLMFSLAGLSFLLNNFMPFMPVILWYLVSINLVTFFLFVIDKYHSIKQRKRVPVRTLHFFSFAGGFVGAFLAMLIAKHKISKKIFLSIQITISLVWVFAIYYVITHLEAIQKALN